MDIDQDENNTERVVVYLPKALAAKLKGYAANRGVGLSVLIRMMLLSLMEKEG